ncbi:MAG: hypothetical protein ACXVEE_14435 [Polyangiales bacterium]
MTKKLTLLCVVSSLAALSGCAAQAGNEVDTATGDASEALCAAQPNLLQNPSFQNAGPLGSSTTVTTSVPGGAGYSAAANWTLFTNTPGTIRTNLQPSSRGDGSNMIHVLTSTGPRNGLVQVFGAFGSGPTHVISGAWVYVVHGQVGIGTGNGGNTGLDALSKTTGQWEYVKAANGAIPANEFIVYGAATGMNEFYVDAASVQQSPDLLTNSSFATVGPNGATTTVTTVAPGGAGNSAAAGWTLFTNTPGTIKTEVVPSTVPFQAANKMIHVHTDGWHNGLVQVFPGSKSCTLLGPTHARGRAMIFVHSGQVGIGTGNGGNTGIDKTTTTTGAWEFVEAQNGASPANEFIVYSTTPGGADFDVAFAEVYEVP